MGETKFNIFIEKKKTERSPLFWHDVDKLKATKCLNVFFDKR
jgi:hypothetical protein